MTNLPAAWTDDEKDRVLRLWKDGVSGTDIAREVGRSRNAVLGLIHRIREKAGEGSGLSRQPVTVRTSREPRPKPTTPPVRDQRPATSVPLFPAPIEIVEEAAPEPAPAPIEEVAARIEEPIPEVPTGPGLGAEFEAIEEKPVPLYFDDEWKAGRCRAPLFSDRIKIDEPVFCGAVCSGTYCRRHAAIFTQSSPPAVRKRPMWRG